MVRVMFRGSPSNLTEPRPGLSRGIYSLLRNGCLRKPRFAGCWVNPSIPSRYEEIETYQVLDSKIIILSSRDSPEITYHLVPWEYVIPCDWMRLLNMVIEEIASRPPKEIASPYRDLKEHVDQIASNALRDLSVKENIHLGKTLEEVESNLEHLRKIAVRYTVGMGLFEVLLADDRIEDIYIDAPCNANSIHLTLSGVRGSNTTSHASSNLMATEHEVEGIVSRLRQYSDRPFSEAFPVLETDLEGFSTRITAIGHPLSPQGTALALRRHSRHPWTLLKLIYNGTLDCHGAGLISFLIDGQSTILICGARGSGKSSLLSACMFEFPIYQRILTIEDTLELPVSQMQQMGFKIQSLLVEQRPGETRENETDEALRVSLRLGESAIVLGEVRGKEAQTLYHSMRTGKAGSAVIGTIHGENARSVYERVVHDMNIAPEVFLATDVVLSMGLHRPGGSQRPTRKLNDIVECVGKDGSVQFRDIMDIGPAQPSGKRSTIIDKIARSWSISYDEALSNIEARAQMRQVLVECAKKGGPEFLEPHWTLKMNQFFWHELEKGERDYQSIATRFRKNMGRHLVA